MEEQGGGARQGQTGAGFLQVVLPVCNEAESIAGTLEELHDELPKSIQVEFIVCEDGSTDDTVAILSDLQKGLPLTVISSRTRKGYSRAVLDGLRSTKAPWVLCLDGDGQCDPRDFEKLWRLRGEGEVLTGSRLERPESWSRRFLSGSFRALFSVLFETGIRDPSSPFVLMSREVLETLVDEMGLFPQGFWWEFIARAVHQGFTVREVPIGYRQRRAGGTRVYELGRIPEIAWTHLIGLVRLWRELR